MSTLMFCERQVLYSKVNTGMAYVAEGNVEAGKRQQATLACTPIVNTHETHHCILSADPWKSYQSRELKIGEKQLFS